MTVKYGIEFEFIVSFTLENEFMVTSNYGAFDDDEVDAQLDRYAQAAAIEIIDAGGAPEGEWDFLASVLKTGASFAPQKMTINWDTREVRMHG